MDELNTLLESFKDILDIPDDVVNDELLKMVLEQLDVNFSSALITQSINQIIANLEDQGADREEAKRIIQSLKDTLHEMVYQDKQYTGNKKIMVDTILNKIFSIFDSAAEKYHSYAIELPMTVEKGAHVPTYAHETDAAADLYAKEDQIIRAGTLGNMIHTGVKIQLPEGWLAMILPRSSMGTKTPLRLSNSVGLIDSGYRGELGVIYDNNSVKDFKINAGDRIAQLLVMPSYRFQAKVVDILADSDRGEGGFGASGT